jgi:hypothetical protein
VFFGELECEVPALAEFGPGSVQFRKGVIYGGAAEVWRGNMGTSIWRLRVAVRDEARPRLSQFKPILEDMVRGFDVRVVDVEASKYKRPETFLRRVESERGELGRCPRLCQVFGLGRRSCFARRSRVG